ncbi:hypothetical protein PF005_g11516 [Phytophthora fragariae]|uniref:Uncharacterized protein n=1 Tax=Phytophthora fragariae TaxID=53985 RepID=A0A6A3Y371_9STRA|nr:hypothetical protein PF007_g20408 [Phytophthora fragariae]KAE9210242.1 hypothetical protein PF005_g11516 [Phytophthora fragariae]
MATQEAQEGPPGGKGCRTNLRPCKEIDGKEVETDDTGEELVEENDEGEEEDDTGKEVKEEEDCDDGEGMDAGSEDVEEGDDGEDGEDMVEEGDADAENADATADDDAVENMVGGATITPGLSRHLRILFASLCVRPEMKLKLKPKNDDLPGAVRLPNHFTHSFQTLWCTHGATKASRGEGLRQGGQHYTGCEAGFKVRSAKVVKKGVAKWVVCIDQETEISTHNHKTTKTIFESYKGAKSMPLTAKVRQDLGLMTEIKTSTAAISRYLLDKLDMVLSPQQTRNILQQDCCWIRLSELMIMAFC